MSLLLVLCSLAFTSLAVWVVADAWQATSRAKALRRDAALANQIFIALQDIRIEGGATSALLAAGGQGLGQQAADVERQEAHGADAAIALARSLAEADVAFSARLAVIQRDIQELRLTAITAVSGGAVSAAAATLPYMTQFDTVITGLESATAVISDRMRQWGDARVNEDVIIRELSWGARSAFGDFRAALGIYVGSGRPMAADERVRIISLHSTGLALWKANERMVTRQDVDVIVKHANEESAGSFTGPIAQWIEAVMASAVAGDRPGVTISDFLVRGIEAGRIAQAVTLAAANAAVRHSEEDARQAEGRMAAAVVVLVLGLSLLTLCLIVLRLRLAEPTRKLTKIVHRLSEGSEEEIAWPRYNDELGRIQMGLILLRKNAINSRLSTEAEVAAHQLAGNRGRQLTVAGDALNRDIKSLAVMLVQEQDRAGTAALFTSDAIAAVREQASVAADEAEGVCTAARSIATSA